MAVIDWVILALGIAFSLVMYFQRKAIKERNVARTQSLGMALLLLAYLEAEARKAKDRQVYKRTDVP